MGTGDVTRYLGAYGSARVAKAVLVSPIPPFLLQAGDNPEGVPAVLFDGFVRAAKADRPSWLKGSWTTSTTSTSTAAPWSRPGLPGQLEHRPRRRRPSPRWSASPPGDRLPRRPRQLRRAGPRHPGRPGPGPAHPITGKRLPGLIKDLHLVVIEGGPHAIPWTHADQVNRALLDFLLTRAPQHPPERKP